MQSMGMPVFAWQLTRHGHGDNGVCALRMHADECGLGCVCLYLKCTMQPLVCREKPSVQPQ